MTRAVPVGAALEEERSKITSQLEEVRHQLQNLIEGLARTGASRAITLSIKDREARQAALENELATLDRRERVSEIELRRLETMARQKVEAWRGVLSKHAPQARQILKQLLRERLVFMPERRHGTLGYHFSGEGSILKLLEGFIPGVLTGGGGVPRHSELEPDRGLPGIMQGLRDSAGFAA